MADRLEIGTDTPHTDALIELVAQIVRAREQAKSARYAPARRMRVVESVNVSSSHGWNDPASEEVKSAAINLRNTLAEAERKKGEHERDQELSRIACTLEAMRAVLPSMAAAASIELGCTARDLCSEAIIGQVLTEATDGKT